MLTIPLQIPTNCSIDECRDENNNADEAMAEQQYNWSNNSNNNNKIVTNGIDKIIYRKKNTIENGDCTKKDKGGIEVGVNKGIKMKKDKEVKGIEKRKCSEKDKTTIEGEYMMEVQSTKEDKIVIDNIIEHSNRTRERQSTFDNKDKNKYEDKSKVHR